MQQRIAKILEKNKDYTQEEWVITTSAPEMAAIIQELQARNEELEKVYNAAKGLHHGTDWNKGTT